MSAPPMFITVLFIIAKTQMQPKFLSMDEWKKKMWCTKREVYSNTILPHETRNISNKQPNLTPKAFRERRTKKPQS